MALYHQLKLLLVFSWQILFILSLVYPYDYKRKKTECKYLFNYLISNFDSLEAAPSNLPP
jgi:hypothetical protein